MKALQVAIDGPAGAGKSTVARRVAEKLGYLYIDTGAMYRAIALKALEEGVRGEEALAELARRTSIRLEHGGPAGTPPRVILDGRDVSEAVRDPRVTAVVSEVASCAAVRARMVELQREMARNGAVVMDGRDIGTVVLPHAQVKVYLTASLAERARRRQKEWQERGHAVSLAEVEQDIARRDQIDSSRATSPLRPAPDAVVVDSTGRSVDEVVAEVLELVRRAQRASCS